MSTVLETAPLVSRSPARRRHWWQTLVWGLVIFVCGGVAGHGVTVWMWQEHGRKVYDPKTNHVANILSRMRDELGLTDDQATQIEDILRRHYAKMGQIHKEVGPLISAERDLMMKETSAVLNDSQRDKWQKRMEEMKRLWSDKSRSAGGGGERRRDGEQRKGEERREKQGSTK